MAWTILTNTTSCKYKSRGKVLLFGYVGSPDMVDVCISARMPDYKMFLEDIVTVLRIPKADVIDRRPAYERF